MLTICQNLRFFLVLTLLIFTEAQEVNTMTLAETLRQPAKGSTSTEIVSMAPDTTLLTTTAWQQCNTKIQSSKWQLDCLLEILILTIFNSEIDYLVPTEGTQMILQVNNHPLALTLGSRIPNTSKDSKNLYKQYQGSTRIYRGSPCWVVSEATLHPTGGQATRSGQDTIVDFPFALFYCSRKRSKSSFQSKITVLGHEINMNWAQRFAPYSISLASCMKISVNLISICFSPSKRHFISSFPTSFFWNQPCAREKKDSVYSFSKHVTEVIQVIQLTQCLTHRKHPRNVDIISIKYEILFYIFLLLHAFGKRNRKISQW